MTPLTPRQAEVLRHLAAGLTDRQIAAELGVSLRTVKNHCWSLYRALGVWLLDRNPRVLAARYWWASEEKETA